MSFVLDTPAGSKQMLSSHLPQIANEIAMNILPVEDIKQLYGFDDASWNALISDPLFDQMLKDALVTWSSAKNAEARIKFKAQAMVEMSLLRFHNDINDTNIVLSARTEALKTIMKLAGMERPEPAQLGGQNGWSLTINLGVGRESVTMKPAGPPTIEGETA